MGLGTRKLTSTLATQDSVTDTACIGLLDLRLGNSGCTTPWSQRGLRSSDAVALQPCHRQGGAEHAGHNVRNLHSWV